MRALSMAKDLHPSVADLSYSRMESWDKCPEAFWHAYINRTQPDGYDRVEAWTGSLVHQVLEEALRETLEKRVPDPVAVLARFDELWREGVGDHVLSVRDDRPLESFRANGRRWVSDYLDDAWPFVRDGTPLHVEEPVEYPVTLPDGRATKFRGVLDRVDLLSDGRLRLMDYKTGSWMPEFDTHRDAFQLALYWPGLMKRYPKTPGGVLAWHYLQHRRTRYVDPDPALLAAAQTWVGETAGAIQGRIETKGDEKKHFPARPSVLCRWCSFGYACDANPYKTQAPKPRQT